MTGAVVQGIINGLALGWIYVLIALGLTLIYGIMNIVQLAHGELYMFGAYLVHYFMVTKGLNIFVAGLVTVILVGVLGVFLERFFFRRARGSFTSAVIISICLTLILVSGVQGVFGIHQRSLPKLSLGAVRLGDIAVPRDRVIVVGVAIVFAACLFVFLRKTTQGKAMVASSQNREGAILGGIDANRMAMLAMGIGCALAAVGGILGGSLFAMSPTMGVIPLLKGLIIIVAGGLGSLLGTVVVGLALGLIDGLGPILLDPAIAVILPFAIVIMVLLFRPQGLFGRAD